MAAYFFRKRRTREIIEGLVTELYKLRIENNDLKLELAKTKLEIRGK